MQKQAKLIITIITTILSCPIMSNGMQENISTQNKESWMHHNDVLKCLTASLYVVNNGKIYLFGKDINALIQVNKVLNHVYSNEKMAKSLVSILAKLDKYTCKHRIAQELLPTSVFKTIYNKINYLFDIIEKNKELTENDLLDPWFIDATKYVSYDDQPKAIIRNLTAAYRKSTLLAEACRNGQLHNVLLLHSCSDIKKCSPGLIIEIAQTRADIADESKKNNYLAIAQLLLEKQMDPDYRHYPRNPTALMITVNNADKELAQLLLSYKANPHHKGLSCLLTRPCYCSEDHNKDYFKDDLMKDAFEMECGEPKGWLKDMVNVLSK